MSLVKRLISGGGAAAIDTSLYDKQFGVVDDMVMACQETALLQSIYDLDKTMLCGDIIASAKVVTEGADPVVLMENMFTSGIEKLKQYWLKFYAAAKKFFAHVIDTVKAMFMEGSKFANTYGKQIKNKIDIVKEFDVKVWPYKIKEGDAFVEDKIKKLSTEAQKTTDTSIAGNNDTSSGFFSDDFNLTEMVENFIGTIDSGSKTAADVCESAVKIYRDNMTDKDEPKWDSSDVDAALKVLTDNSTDISRIKKEWETQEKAIKKVISALDVMGNKKAKTKNDDGTAVPEDAQKIETKRYKAATNASKYNSSLLTAARTLSQLEVQIHKDRYKEYTAILKSFFAFKREKAPVEDGFVCEGCEEFDFDMDDVSENAIAGASTPEGRTSDMGIALEGYSGNNSTLAAAYKMLGL